jgi:hypothetical protein
MLCISGLSDLLYARCVHKQLWSTFFPIPVIGVGVFERCGGSNGCTWKRFGIALAANPVLGEELNQDPSPEVQFFLTRRKMFSRHPTLRPSQQLPCFQIIQVVVTTRVSESALTTRARNRRERRSFRKCLPYL